MQLAKHRGCPPAIAVSRQAAHRAKDKELGAGVVIDGTGASAVAVLVRGATDGEDAGVVFGCVGQRSTLDACVGWGGAVGKRDVLVLFLLEKKSGGRKHVSSVGMSDVGTYLC